MLTFPSYVKVMLAVEFLIVLANAPVARGNEVTYSNMPITLASVL